MSNRSETFGRLLRGAINSIATYEGKTAPVIEEELAEKVGLAGSAIQRYKAGYLPPEPRTIEIIAEAAVRRGFLSREWLQRFLHAAHYHQAEKLLDQLCPIGPARPRPPRIYQNLPAPTYSQFVERKEAAAEVLEGLSKRSAAVIIVGLGGNGKTSLARETADYCLKGEEGLALFDAAVWVSDKDRPGTTNLSIVLDEIARTLDYPGFTQFEHDEKRREVEQLLRRQRVLVCVDNFETITDGALLSWLLNLPEPSKALITTREYRREYRRGGWPVELRGMSDSEARALIDERLHVLRIERLVVERAQFEPLIAATGGNPKAIGITLGLVKHERRPLQQVVDDLYAARGELFDDLFDRAWSLLDEAARRVLIVTTFFPLSVDEKVLGATADVGGFALERSIERLNDLALLDVHQHDINAPSQYTVHPLVSAFARSKLKLVADFELPARYRWVEHLKEQLELTWQREPFTSGVILIENSVTILAFSDWSFQNEQWELFLDIYKAAETAWDISELASRKLMYAQQVLEVAHRVNDVETQIKILLRMARLSAYSRQPEALYHYTRAQNLWNTSIEKNAWDKVRYRMETTHAIVLIFSNEAGKALHLLQEQIKRESDLVRINTRKYWMGVCLESLHQRKEAIEILVQVLQAPREQLSLPTICRASGQLTEIYLAEGDPVNARKFFEESTRAAVQLKDRYIIGQILRWSARLRALEGNLSEARKAFLEAIDLFERLGTRRELAEAREELRRLDGMGEAPEA